MSDAIVNGNGMDRADLVSNTDCNAASGLANIAIQNNTPILPIVSTVLIDDDDDDENRIGNNVVIPTTPQTPLICCCTEPGNVDDDTDFGAYRWNDTK